jgi:hypothetical protein
MIDKEMLLEKAKEKARKLIAAYNQWGENKENQTLSFEVIELSSLFRGYIEALYDAEILDEEGQEEITRITFPPEMPSAFSEFIKTLNLNDFDGHQKEET